MSRGEDDSAGSSSSSDNQAGRQSYHKPRLDFVLGKESIRASPLTIIECCVSARRNICIPARLWNWT